MGAALAAPSDGWACVNSRRPPCTRSLPNVLLLFRARTAMPPRKDVVIYPRAEQLLVSYIARLGE